MINKLGCLPNLTDSYYSSGLVNRLVRNVMYDTISDGWKFRVQFAFLFPSVKHETHDQSNGPERCLWNRQQASSRQEMSVATHTCRDASRARSIDNPVALQPQNTSWWAPQNTASAILHQLLYLAFSLSSQNQSIFIQTNSHHSNSCWWRV